MMTTDPEVARARKTLIIEVTQSTVAVLMIGAIVFNVVTGRGIPDAFVNMVLLVVGFYFGRSSSNGK